jgi:hypothetical protein
MYKTFFTCNIFYESIIIKRNVQLWYLFGAQTYIP